jgi:hypothetical protein
MILFSISPITYDVYVHYNVVLHFNVKISKNPLILRKPSITVPDNLTRKLRRKFQDTLFIKNV